MLKRSLFYIFDLCYSDLSPARIAAAITLAMLVGANPPFTLQWLIFITAAFILRVNLVVLATAAPFFYLLSKMLDPIHHRLGWALLVDFESAHDFWAWLYHAPIVPFTRFNNTVVLGNLLVTLCVSPFFFMALKPLVQRLQPRLVERLNDLNWWHWWTTRQWMKEYRETKRIS